MKETIKNNTTELVFILDRSGSMHGLEPDTIGGFNSMLEKQKAEDGRAYVTTVLFNDQLVTLHDRLDVQTVAPLTGEDYTTAGCTALFDAVGRTVRHIANIHKYARPEDVPARTVFVITTDGMENASREFRRGDVKALIEKQKEAGWEFLFIAANIDAEGTAADVGIDGDHAVNYCADSAGTSILFKSVSRAISNARVCSAPLAPSWKEDIEEDFNKRG